MMQAQWIKLQVAAYGLRERLKREDGGISLEYGGVFIAAGLIVVVLVGAASGWGESIRDAIQTAIDDVLGAGGG
jgi:Flp pilus assembly pilin Flp